MTIRPIPLFDWADNEFGLQAAQQDNRYISEVLEEWSLYGSSDCATPAYVQRRLYDCTEKTCDEFTEWGRCWYNYCTKCMNITTEEVDWPTLIPYCGFYCGVFEPFCFYESNIGTRICKGINRIKCGDCYCFDSMPERYFTTCTRVARVYYVNSQCATCGRGNSFCAKGFLYGPEEPTYEYTDEDGCVHTYMCNDGSCAHPFINVNSIFKSDDIWQDTGYSDSYVVVKVKGCIDYALLNMHPNREGKYDSWVRTGASTDYSYRLMIDFSCANFCYDFDSDHPYNIATAGLTASQIFDDRIKTWEDRFENDDWAYGRPDTLINARGSFIIKGMNVVEHPHAIINHFYPGYLCQNWNCASASDGCYTYSGCRWFNNEFTASCSSLHNLSVIKPYGQFSLMNLQHVILYCSNISVDVEYEENIGGTDVCYAIMYPQGRVQTVAGVCGVSLPQYWEPWPDPVYYLETNYNPDGSIMNLGYPNGEFDTRSINVITNPVVAIALCEGCHIGIYKSCVRAETYFYTCIESPKLIEKTWTYDICYDAPAIPVTDYEGNTQLYHPAWRCAWCYDQQESEWWGSYSNNCAIAISNTCCATFTVQESCIRADANGWAYHHWWSEYYDPDDREYKFWHREQIEGYPTAYGYWSGCAKGFSNPSGLAFDKLNNIYSEGVWKCNNICAYAENPPLPCGGGWDPTHCWWMATDAGAFATPVGRTSRNYYRNGASWVCEDNLDCTGKIRHWWWCNNNFSCSCFYTHEMEHCSSCTSHCAGWMTAMSKTLFPDFWRVVDCQTPEGFYFVPNGDTVDGCVYIPDQNEDENDV